MRSISLPAEQIFRKNMARTLLATLPAAALALRATRTTVSMHTNIFPTFTIKDKAAVLGLSLIHI